ncbi:hypothetical protein [Paenibacillus xylanilyticus]|uniref:hypothetical protein n=1 Tax=Paenibacillus xylanilyticus TaxID=248903 RepID=UPI003AAC8CFC
MTKDDLLKRLNQLTVNISFVKKRKRDDLFTRGKELELEIMSCETSNEINLVKLKYELLKLENEVDNGAFWRKLGLYLALAFALITYAFVFMSVRDIEMKEYFSYFFSSVVGALTYFISTKAIGGTDAPIWRLLTAMALPFMFISFLFNNSSGQLIDIKDKLLWAFMFGYSCELFVLLMNKIIYKLKKAIG